mmetsp:Transcript_76530/g.127565  ORF Transcript_76530/g.127565 Transcript_76530/m.127565 type:complete len:548 (-) Transcript_76530:118-1761(-)|eukprot:CAMPEP_0119336370 /NCGR_PEP_ID=MMETSP1333-20130426/91659_1 /TAXON_ID=418940 /ORGANISM="Scyphosphaera apsteinii, Strain RCC1455" /LENGTH=547 /DNA_ID=CAMNT_0007347153 /DNA_START=127 /DNA_END=1770 /DNA_ORIENTATION=+
MSTFRVTGASGHSSVINGEYQLETGRDTMCFRNDDMYMWTCNGRWCIGRLLNVGTTKCRAFVESSVERPELINRTRATWMVHDGWSTTEHIPDCHVQLELTHAGGALVRRLQNEAATWLVRSRFPMLEKLHDMWPRIARYLDVRSLSKMCSLNKEVVRMLMGTHGSEIWATRSREVLGISDACEPRWWCHPMGRVSIHTSQPEIITSALTMLRLDCTPPEVPEPAFAVVAVGGGACRIARCLKRSTRERASPSPNPSPIKISTLLIDSDLEDLRPKHAYKSGAVATENSPHGLLSGDGHFPPEGVHARYVERTYLASTLSGRAQGTYTYFDVRCDRDALSAELLVFLRHASDVCVLVGVGGGTGALAEDVLELLNQVQLQLEASAQPRIRIVCILPAAASSLLPTPPLSPLNSMLLIGDIVSLHIRKIWVQQKVLLLPNNLLLRAAHLAARCTDDLSLDVVNSVAADEIASCCLHRATETSPLLIPLAAGRARPLLRQVVNNYQVMYAKRAFHHWLVGCGISEDSVGLEYKAELVLALVDGTSQRWL